MEFIDTPPDESFSSHILVQTRTTEIVTGESENFGRLQNLVTFPFPPIHS